MAKFQKRDAKEYEAEQEQRKTEIGEKVKNIIENFETDPEKMLEFIKFKSKFYNYSTNNTVLIYSQNRGATFVGSFLKFKQLGEEFAKSENVDPAPYYGVKKGETGMSIFVPVQVTLLENDEGNLVKLSAADKNLVERYKTGEIKSVVKTSFKIGTVFDIAQTSIPEEYYPRLFSMGYTSEQHRAVADGLEAYCHANGITVNTADLKSISLRGTANTVDGTITLNDRLKDSQRADTFAHELGHNKMHSGHTADVAKIPGCVMEIEADVFSIMLSEHLSLDVSDTRKEHLTDNYKLYSELRHEKKNVKLPTFEEMVNKVSTTFTELLPELEPFINKEFEMKETIDEQKDGNKDFYKFFYCGEEDQAANQFQTETGWKKIWGTDAQGMNGDTWVVYRNASDLPKHLQKYAIAQEKADFKALLNNTGYVLLSDKENAFAAEFIVLRSPSGEEKGFDGYELATAFLKSQREDKDLDGIPDFIDSRFDPEVYRYLEVKDAELSKLEAQGIKYEKSSSKKEGVSVIKYKAEDEKAIKAMLASVTATIRK